MPWLLACTIRSAFTNAWIDLRGVPPYKAVSTTRPGELKVIAAILERPVIQRILDQLGLDPQPPPKAQAREPGLHFAA